MSDFTPGPWMAASRPSSIVGWPVVARPEGRSVANVSWLPGLSPQMEAEIAANARLIAAAPQTHEALAALVDIIDRAGLLNLSNGVQLGQISWYVKASDRLEAAREALNTATAAVRGEG